MRDVLQLSPEVDDPNHGIAPRRLQGTIEFRNVSFDYDGRPVLQDVSFTIRPGELVAIVGPSGSGKTTLVSLLPAFYQAASGTVLIDGRNVADYRLDALRTQTSIVLQEAVVLSGSIRENLRYGRLDATNAEIEEAARAANAHEFIARMPDGYDTQLAYAAPGVSGGQRQRLSMARAFLKNAPILILD